MQKITTPKGEALVVLPLEEYQSLLDRPRSAGSRPISMRGGKSLSLPKWSTGSWTVKAPCTSGVSTAGYRSRDWPRIPVSAHPMSPKSKAAGKQAAPRP